MKLRRKRDAHRKEKDTHNDNPQEKKYQARQEEKEVQRHSRKEKTERNPQEKKYTRESREQEKEVQRHSRKEKTERKKGSGVRCWF